MFGATVNVEQYHNFKLALVQQDRNYLRVISVEVCSDLLWLWLKLREA